MAARAEDAAPALCAFAAVAATAFANGGYFPTEWGWTLLGAALVALLAVLLRERPGAGRFEVVAVAALLAFAGWTALSAAWSVSAAQPVLATERTLVYAVAVPAALLVTTSRARAPMLLAGVLAAATVVCGYALVTRLAPGWATTYPPASGGYQLQEPIGYWNGVGILAAVGSLVGLGLTAGAADRRARALTAAPLPLLLATLYFTFSRGSWLALLAGLGVAVAVETKRLRLLGVLAVCSPAPVLAVLLASRSSALTHESASLAAARSAGWKLAVALALCTAAAAALGWALEPVERRVELGERTRRVLGGSLAGLVLLAAVAVLVRVGGPIGLAHRVSASFNSSLPATGGDLNRRLTSISSDGRNDYWRVAWHEVVDHPLLGGGAGSYERYWRLGRPTAYEAQNAHNLYLETLAELGPVGLALLLAFLAAIVGAALRSRRDRFTAAGVAGFAAFAVHAAVDWDFQIVSVSLAGMLCGAALLVAARERETGQAHSSRRRVPAVVVLLGVTAVAIAVQVGNSALANGRAALDRGELGRAQSLAHRAHRWQPWSYEPWQLLGETALAAGDLDGARRGFRQALRLDRRNWSLWYDLAQATTGAARKAALAEASRLDPQSPELTQISPKG